MRIFQLAEKRALGRACTQSRSAAEAPQGLSEWPGGAERSRAVSWSLTARKKGATSFDAAPGFIPDWVVSIH